jgi:hypothetical protein
VFRNQSTKATDRKSASKFVKIFETADEAVKDIRDHAQIMIGGFDISLFETLLSRFFNI